MANKRWIRSARTIRSDGDGRCRGEDGTVEEKACGEVGKNVSTVDVTDPVKRLSGEQTGTQTTRTKRAETWASNLG